MVNTFFIIQQNLAEYLLSGAGITEYKAGRVDMRFDSYDATHYRKYAKLNRYIISALVKSVSFVKGN